ncbi:hypothetical protein F3Y22_tig00111137pilonHSYRG00005 [Hibiscus syriacus]|uniref:Uncharacterized protein n=1 Tax=Hibiscus syriacus TaxID=106335 RepID=A0A6A2YZH3_HIBSY|nr:hypothetical protein F3Y22_tig00111137pilonHSYRG00005 [Hibiscus syriacus]
MVMLMLLPGGGLGMNPSMDDMDLIQAQRDLVRDIGDEIDLEIGPGDDDPSFANTPLLGGLSSLEPSAEEQDETGSIIEAALKSDPLEVGFIQSVQEAVHVIDLSKCRNSQILEAMKQTFNRALKAAMISVIRKKVPTGNTLLENLRSSDLCYSVSGASIGCHVESDQDRALLHGAVISAFLAIAQAMTDQGCV